jgi:hypothetical protein
MNDDKNRYTKDPKNDNKKRRMMLLIPLHILAVIGIAFLIVSLVQAQHEIRQITMIPTPGAIESLPQESIPLANPTPSLTATAPGVTATPTVALPTATATSVPTPTPTAAPTARPTAHHTARPTAEYTYKVSAKQGVAPAGYMIVSVVVEPAGDYTVTYDGQAMEFNGKKYYLTVQALPEGESYRSHVSVKKN